MPADIEVEVGIPASKVLPPEGDVITGVLPAGRYVVGDYVGDYSGLMEANAALQTWAETQQVTWDGAVDGDVQTWACRMEEYLTDPDTSPDPVTWVTRLAYKIR